MTGKPSFIQLDRIGVHGVMAFAMACFLLGGCLLSPITAAATPGATSASDPLLSSGDAASQGTSIDAANGGAGGDGSRARQAALDYGDAPDAIDGTGSGNYNTRAADNGPSHAIVPDLWLGAVGPDGDDGSLQNVAATADDFTAIDDEDFMVTMPAILTVSTSVELNVRAFNNTVQQAAVACWIDFNQNGVFTDPGERQAATISIATGMQTVAMTFSGFAPPTFGSTYLRCRIANNDAEVNLPTGPASSGEVEDYLVEVAEPPTAVTLTRFSVSSSAGSPALHQAKVSESCESVRGRLRSAMIECAHTCLAWLLSVQSQARPAR